MKQTNWITFPDLPDQFPLSTDSVVLADFAAVSNHAAVFDLCAGPGTLGLLLGARYPGCHVDGIELQPGAVSSAAAIIRQNRMEDRVSVTQGDLRRIQTLFPSGRYDAVLSNPPYFPAGSGAAASSGVLALSRMELSCTLADVCQAAAWLLHHGGRFFLVHRPERLCDLMTELRNHRLEPKRLRLVRHSPALPPALALIESRLGGKPGLTIEQDLILHGEDGVETEEYRRIYRLGGT